MTYIAPSEHQLRENRSAGFDQDDHWYNDDEINILLKDICGRHINTELLTAMLGTDWQAGNTLRDQLIHFNTQRSNNIRQGISVKDEVVIPVNLGTSQGEGMHWVLLYLKYNRDPALLPRIIYVDPFGREIPPVILQTLRLTALFPHVQVDSNSVRLQHDSYNCGPWIVAAAQFLLEQTQEVDVSVLMQRIEGLDIHQVRQIQGGVFLNTGSAPASTSQLLIPVPEVTKTLPARVVLPKENKSENLATHSIRSPEIATYYKALYDKKMDEDVTPAKNYQYARQVYEQFKAMDEKDKQNFNKAITLLKDAKYDLATLVGFYHYACKNLVGNDKYLLHFADHNFQGAQIIVFNKILETSTAPTSSVAQFAKEKLIHALARECQRNPKALAELQAYPSRGEAVLPAKTSAQEVQQPEPISRRPIVSF